MKHIRQTAFNILKNLKTYNITVEELKNVVKQQGYTIVEFNQVSNSKDVEVILKELNLKAYSSSVNAFAYADNDVRIVFIHNGLSSSETIVLLAHECGHILLNHMSKNTGVFGAEIAMENEANEFSHYLLYPGLLTKLQLFFAFYKRFFINFLLMIALALLLISSIYFCLPKISSTLTSGKSDIVENSESTEVYVTPRGDKYHTAECPYIKSNQHAKKLNIDDAKKLYSPCKICNPKTTTEK